MRNLINIVEAAQRTPVMEKIAPMSIDMAPPSVKADIVDMVLGPHGPQSFLEYYGEAYGVNPTGEDVSSFLFGSSDLSKTGELFGASLNIHPVSISPKQIYSGSRSVSDAVVLRYSKADSKTIPPVLVRKQGQEWKLIEGGHRVAAAMAAGWPVIPAYDVSSFWETDWEDFDS